jgi:hypothetical protein
MPEAARVFKKLMGILPLKGTLQQTAGNAACCGRFKNPVYGCNDAKKMEL